jgi:hypothetical protein
MQTNRQTPYSFQIPGNVSGTSGAQASLILLILVFLLVLMARTTIGDAIISAAGEFANFRVWGTDNIVNGSDNNNLPGNITTSAYNATVVSVDMPDQMTQGDNITARITMKNTGIANWYANGSSTVMLGAVGGNSRDAYRFTHVTYFPTAAGTIVRKGENYTFSFNLVAPAPGQYLPEFQMTGDDAGGFGEIASKRIIVTTVPTPTPAPTPWPTIAPTPEPTYPPYESYVAYGKFVLYDSYGRQMFGGPWYWIYDGPFGSNNLRSSYFCEPTWPHPDWDIGGPNGQYYVYKEGCTGSGSFSMNNGGVKGTITFRFIN